MRMRLCLFIIIVFLIACGGGSGGSGGTQSLNPTTPDPTVAPSTTATVTSGVQGDGWNIKSGCVPVSSGNELIQSKGTSTTEGSLNVPDYDPSATSRELFDRFEREGIDIRGIPTDAQLKQVALALAKAKQNFHLRRTGSGGSNGQMRSITFTQRKAVPWQGADCGSACERKKYAGDAYEGRIYISDSMNNNIPFNVLEQMDYMGVMKKPHNYRTDEDWVAAVLAD